MRRVTMRRRRWPRVLAGLIVLALATAGVAVVQPPWAFSLLSRIWPRIVWRVQTSQPLVALSFDDGPASAATPDVLAMLAHRGARATFFLIGERARAHPDLVRVIRAGGHELGNHSDGTVSLLRASDTEFEESLLRAERTLGLGRDRKLFRPPGGLIRASQMALAEAHGYRCVLGSAYPYDSLRPSVGYIRWLVPKNLAPGAIVILHDGTVDPSRSLAALEGILASGEQQGLRFVTVGELLAASGK